MVYRTYYTDGAELTYQEKNHLIPFINDLENYNIYYQTPAHYIRATSARVELW